MKVYGRGSRKKGEKKSLNRWTQEISSPVSGTEEESSMTCGAATDDEVDLAENSKKAHKEDFID